MTKTPAAGKARTKSKDTPESEKSGGPAIRPAPTDEAPGDLPEGAPPVPTETPAPAAPAADAETPAATDRSEGTAGSVSAAGSAVGGGAEAGKGDGASAGTAPDPGQSSAPQFPAAVERAWTALFGPDPDGVEVIIVTGPERGRRRCGVRFGAEPETIPIPLLRPGELEAIEGDPELKVTRDFRKFVPR